MTDDLLRPLGAGELLDQAFGLFRRLFVPLVLIQVITSAIPFLLNLYIAARGGATPGVTFTMYLIAFVFGSLASAATAYLISESYLGRDLTAGDALRRALPRVFAVMLLSVGLGLVVVLAALPSLLAIGAGAAFAGLGVEGQVRASPAMGASLVLVGLVLLALPVAAFSALAISTPSLVLEGISPGAALSRSWSLTRGYRLRTIGLLFVVMLVVLIPVIAIGGLGRAFYPEPTSRSIVLITTLSGLASLVVTPILYCVLTLLYYDLRVRKEAFDLEMLAAQLPTA